MKIEIIPEAQDDILRAIFWYEDKKFDLGVDFFSAIEESISLISKNIEIGFCFSENLRRFVLREFPFCIYYCTDEASVTFLGFLHAHSDPKKIIDSLSARRSS